MSAASRISAARVTVELDDVRLGTGRRRGSRRAVDIAGADELPDHVIVLARMDGFLHQKETSKSEGRYRRLSGPAARAVSDRNGQDSAVVLPDALRYGLIV